MKTNQPRLNSINTVLQDHQMHSLVSLAAQSRRLEKLIQAWPPLRGVTFSVGPIKQTTLKLFVSSPSAITRIRQSLPSLIEYLQQTGANITQVQLQIQSQPSLSKQLHKKPKRAVFTASAKQAWLELEKKLEDSPIRQATEALNRHHKFK